MDNGRGVDTGRTLASAQGATSIKQRIFEARDIVYTNADSETTASYPYYGTNNVNTAVGYVFTVRPRNVAVLYCVKN